LPQKKVLYIISNVFKSHVFEWTADGLNADYDLTFLLLNETGSALEDFLIARKIKIKRIRYRDKWDLFSAGVRTFFHVLFNRPHIVHAHLLDAQLIGLTTAWLLRINKRIYTRHTSNYHQEYHPGGVRLDRWSNKMATDIISISQATDKTLIELEGVDPGKITRIPHGFDMNVFSNVGEERIRNVKIRWDIAGGPVVGVIARQIEWKGIQYIIPAFNRFLNEYPDACLVLANATGPYSTEIQNLLVETPKRNFVLIPFEADVAALYKNFDIYVHTPVDAVCEAFGQTYVEALALGIPAVFTLSGIASEFVIHNVNAYVAGFRNSEDIVQGLFKIQKDVGYRKDLIENGKKSVIYRFENTITIGKLKQLYNS
jgi:glycosyltransferase involved in cell wall biosynthesis